MLKKITGLTVGLEYDYTFCMELYINAHLAGGCTGDELLKLILVIN
jgi:hypothetical protein